MTHATKGRHLLIYKVVFDGTMNDAARIPIDERTTIVTHIRDRIGAHYYPGPGMQDSRSINWPDAAIGYSSARTALEAESDFFAEVSKQVAADPDIEVRVFVAGFSRGAATARHFMNIVTQDWVNCSACTQRNRPEFFAILYDTVATFQMNSLQLSLAPTVNFLIHVMAVDELRMEFKPLIDFETNDMLVADSESEDRLESDRIRLLVLPGSHSDIGTSYQEGVGTAYRNISEMWLHQFGLLKQNCWESTSDPFVAGKHDSRGMLDKLLLTPAPNSKETLVRTAHQVPTKTMDLTSEKAMIEKLRELKDAQFLRGIGTFSHTKEYPPLRMTLLRHGSNLSLINLHSKYFDPTSFRYEFINGMRRISLHMKPPYDNQNSTLLIGEDIWGHLKDGEASELTYGLHFDPQGRVYMAIDINGVLISSDQWNAGPTTKIVNPSFNCERDEDGTLISPVKYFIFRGEGSTDE